jgi:hypothetical protein
MCIRAVCVDICAFQDDDKRDRKGENTVAIINDFAATFGCSVQLLRASISVANAESMP